MDNRRSSGGIEFENLKATELRLGLPGTDDKPTLSQKRGLNASEIDQPVAKAQAVGWPPVRNNRRSNFLAKKTETDQSNGIFVKVSMDGAPFLRKLDLKTCKGYKELREELNNMFSRTISVEHAIAYEDKDGDLMLVGDVPWCMFISSCKKLRVMKGSEARGLNIDQ